MCVVCVTVAGTVLVASQIVPVEVFSEFTSKSKTLSSFSGSSVSLNLKQKNEIKKIAKDNPEAETAICTGLIKKGSSKAATTSARNRAKAACGYLVQVKRGMKTSVVTRTTTVRTSIGKVSVTLRTPKEVVETEPIASPSPQVPVEPASLDDIKNYEQITYWAWKKSSDKIQRSDNVAKQVNVLIGPNSGILNKDPLAATVITSKLFAGYSQPSNITFISFAFEDSAWTQQKLESLMNDAELMNMIKSPNRGGDKGQTIGICPSVPRCHSSSPFTNRKGESIVLAGYTADRLDNVGETKGELQAHEYTHVVQQHQFIGTANELEGLASLRQHLPWWLAEGGADFGGIVSVNHNDYSGYKTLRMRDVYRVPKQTAAWFENFIKPPSLEYWVELGNNGDIYNIGFMVVEIFTAIKGPDAQMEITKLLAGGKTMDQAFEQVFQMPWKTAVPIIAKLIAEERAKY